MATTVVAELYQGKAMSIDYTPSAAVTAGDVVQLPDGRAAVAPNGIAANAKGAVNVCGIYKVQKTASIVLLAGGRVYLDHSAEAAHFKKVNDRDFYIGRVHQDAASSDTTVYVDLNIDPPYDIDMGQDPYDSVIVLTAGTPQLRRLGGAHSLEFSATDEAQKIDMLSKDGFSKDANAIVEFAVEVVDNGDSGEGDFNIGVANATHASDADAITEAVLLHIDTNALDILAESDDGTTEVAATDTTVNYAEGTRFEGWIDMRDPADCQIYIDGVLMLSGSTFNVDAATGPFKLIAHLEKSGNDTPGEFHVDWLRARLMQEHNPAA